jgi:hypothetical protein
VADTLALEQLYDAVVARFTADGTVATSAFGWREPARQTPPPSCRWYPGDPSGSLGELGAPKQPGRMPRSLGTLGERFTVVIASHDATAPDDERKQYKATRLLFDDWWRAVYLAAYGTVRVVSARWVIEKVERRYGATIEVVCAIEAMLPDAAQATAPTDVRAVVTVEQAGNEETFETAPAPEPPPEEDP